jgi:hypothetical protein
MGVNEGATERRGPVANDTGRETRRPAAAGLRRAATATVLIVALTGLAAGPGAAPPAAAQGVVSRELRTEAARLFRELADLRGLPAPGPAPPVVVRTREERRRFIERELGRKYPPARLEAERAALVAWGLVPTGFDLTTFLTDLVLEQAAAYYDPTGKLMVLASWLGPEEQKDALAHELVHALQDRQIDLDAFLASPPGRSDETLARQALVEGEALALTLDLALRRQGQSLAALPDVTARQRAIVSSATGPLFSRAPRFVRAMLLFPYAEGLGFVHQLVRRLPWGQLGSLYKDPPRSTAQILHPERYLDTRRGPVAVPLANLADVLPGARRIIEDDAGEFGLQEILAEHLGGGVDGADAAGWRGDRYAVWDDAGTLALVSLSAWESEAAARSFAQAYSRLLGRKHGLSALAGERALATWRQEARAFAVERRGRAVLVVEQAPASALDDVRRRVWDRAAAGAMLE